MQKTIAAILVTVPLVAFAMQVNPQGAAKWACGGVSADERRSLPGLMPDANLELLFVSGKRGAYVSGVQWRILDRGNEPVAYGTSDGPQCLLRVPEGALRVEALLNGETKSAKANVRAGEKRARLVFTFAPEPGEDIEASPEEKAQARE